MQMQIAHTSAESNNGPTPVPDAGGVPRADHQPRRPRVLLVDDDAALLAALTIQLEARGFDVISVAESYNAAELAIRSRPDVIILDVEMPFCTGLEVHECLRYTRRGREIPILYLTGRDGQSSRLEAIQHGAQRYFTKPFDVEKLAAALHEVILARRRRGRPLPETLPMPPEARASG